MPTTLLRLIRNQDGQALVEYALILLLIAMVAVGVLTALGSGVSNLIDSAYKSL